MPICRFCQKPFQDNGQLCTACLLREVMAKLEQNPAVQNVPPVRAVPFDPFAPEAAPTGGPDPFAGPSSAPKPFATGPMLFASEPPKKPEAAPPKPSPEPPKKPEASGPKPSATMRTTRPPAPNPTPTPTPPPVPKLKRPDPFAISSGRTEGGAANDPFREAGDFEDPMRKKWGPVAKPVSVPDEDEPLRIGGGETDEPARTEAFIARQKPFATEE